MKLDTYNTFEQNYKILPTFIKGALIKRVDLFPLESLMKLYNSDESISRINKNIFIDSDNGWMLRIMNKRGFKISKHFYVGYFNNKRLGKRYIFGILPNKKVTLIAICTHVSAKLKQKNNSTYEALTLGRAIIRRRWKKITDSNILDIEKIDYKIFKRMKNPKRFYPKWYEIYKLAFKAKMYYK